MAKIFERPIGIFDSGIGGLTVFAAVRKLLPEEPVIYLGDTARVPYGNKSAETIVRYASECAAFLIERRVKALVIACNTASAYALPALSKKLDIPVLGVIEPGAQAALAVSKNKCVGVIGTSGTILSNAYGSVLKSLNSKVRVVSRACPLFVPLVEEGWTNNDIAHLVAKEYLATMGDEGIDTLILGCTHYPLLAGVIKDVVGPKVGLVDSAETTAKALGDLLEKNNIRAAAGKKNENHIYVTDLPSKFETIARRFLKEELPAVTRVDL